MVLAGARPASGLGAEARDGEHRRKGHSLAPDPSSVSGSNEMTIINARHNHLIFIYTHTVNNNKNSLICSSISLLKKPHNKDLTGIRESTNCR
jgi:hypothetical protein